MKNTIKLIVPLMILMTMLLCFVGVNAQECQSLDLFEMLNDDMVLLYEKEIAGKSVVSNQSSAKLEKIAYSLNVSVQKLKAMLIIQDMTSRVNESVSLKELAQLSDLQLIAFAKDKVDKYGETLTPQEKADLKAKAKDALSQLGIRI